MSRINIVLPFSEVVSKFGVRIFNLSSIAVYHKDEDNLSGQTYSIPVIGWKRDVLYTVYHGENVVTRMVIVN
jgi:hypothetical protein